MRVLSGRADTVAADHALTRSLLDAPVQPTVRVWRPARHVAFGPRDVRAAGYERAREVAWQRGYAVHERSTGGRAVAYTGTTICFAHVDTVADERVGLTDRYDRVTECLSTALTRVGVDIEHGEPADAFCPGSYSLSAGGKLAGVAQRIRQNAALTAGIVIPRDRDELASILNPVYQALDIPFDPDTVGSVRRAGSDATPETLREAITDALVAGFHSGQSSVQHETVTASVGTSDRDATTSGP